MQGVNRPGVSKATVKKVRDVLNERGYQLEVRQKRQGSVFKNRSIAFLGLGEDALQSHSSAFMSTFNGVESVVSDVDLTLICAKSNSIQALPPHSNSHDGIVAPERRTKPQGWLALNHGAFAGSTPSEWLGSGIAIGSNP